MTKVDFGILDNLGVKPVGIYGSKSEIIRFLYDHSAVDDQVYVSDCPFMLLSVINHLDDRVHMLHLSHDETPVSGCAVLRSGIYFLRFPGDSVVYVIYWPQDSTWDDGAISSVVKNRVTFMRLVIKDIYLIKAEHSVGI